MESATVETSDGVKLDARIVKPTTLATGSNNLAVVLVHPYIGLSGFQGLLRGRGVATGLAEEGYMAVLFDMRAAARASLSGFVEVNDVIAVCKWVSVTFSPDGIVLVGSSAGAPIAGSAVDKIDEIVGYVSLGYPFGLTAFPSYLGDTMVPSCGLRNQNYS